MNKFEKFQEKLIEKHIEINLLDDKNPEIKTLKEKKITIYNLFKEELINEIKNSETNKIIQQLEKNLIRKINLFNNINKNSNLEIKIKKSKKNKNIIFLNDFISIRQDNSKNNINISEKILYEECNINLDLIINKTKENIFFQININFDKNLNYKYINLWKNEFVLVLNEQISKNTINNLIKINSIIKEKYKYEKVNETGFIKPLEKILIESKDFYDLILLSEDKIENKNIIEDIDFLLKEISKNNHNISI